MNKKTLYILLFFVSILSLLVACEDSNTKSTLKLNMTEVSMNIGEVVKLDVTNASGNVTFVSEDDSVATVDNDGQITAITSGQTTITVSDDDESLVCNVIVLAPEFDGTYMVSVETEVVDLIIGDEYQLQPQLLKGLEVVENANFKYTSMDETIVSVENGKIKALKIGETFIQIDSLDYENTSKIVKVVVSEDFTIDLSDGNLVLSRMEILDYKTSEEISYVVKENGNVLDVNELNVYVSDDNIVSVEKVEDKYLIKALNFGKVKVSFSYKKADGSETFSFVNVEVVKPLIELDNEYYFSKVNGIVDFTEFDFSKYNLDVDATACTKVYDNIGNEFSILSKTENSVVINSKNNIAENGENKKMFYDMSEFIVTFDIVQCTLAIRTVEDFLSMSDLLEFKLCDDNKEHRRIDGYIFLVNDLDFTGVEYVPFCGFLELEKDFGGRSGWSAIFEGNYKMLKNITLGSSGHKEWNSIFGNVGWDAEIRNLAIVDCKFAENAAGAVISDYFHGTISNVFISVTLDTVYTETVPDDIEKKTNGFTIATPYKYSTIEELTVVVTNTLPDNIFNNVISGGPVYSAHSGTYNLINSPIKSMVSIGGGNESKLLYGFNSVDKIKEENGLNGYIMNYETIEEAANSVIADNGSTSFSVEDGKLQIKFDGIIVYNE